MFRRSGSCMNCEGELFRHLKLLYILYKHFFLSLVTIVVISEEAWHNHFSFSIKLL